MKSLPYYNNKLALRRFTHYIIYAKTNLDG